MIEIRLKESVMVLCILFAMFPLVSALDVDIAPAKPHTSDDLKCNINGYAEDYLFRWYRNGKYYTEGYGKDVISHEETKKGDKWECRVYSYLGSFGLTEAGRASTSIVNAVPSISLLEPENNAIVDDEWVSFRWQGYDEDDDELSYTLFVGNSLETMQEVVEIKSKSYTMHVERGEQYYWKVRVCDGQECKESRAWSFSVKEEVEQCEPELYVTTNQINFGEIEKGLTAERSFYIGNRGCGKLSYNIEYDIDIVVSPSFGIIDREQSEKIIVRIDTNKLNPGYYEAYLRISSNGGAANVKLIAMVKAKPIPQKEHMPKALNVHIEPLRPKTTDRLTCEYDFYDEDDDDEGKSVVKWYKNGIFWKAGKVLDSSYTKKGDVWKCSVEPVDSKGNHGTISYSPPITIENSPPKLKKNIEDQIGKESMAFVINLRDYFYDPDVEDGVETLTYYIPPLSHFQSKLIGDIVTFTPHSKHGIEHIVIVASDSHASVSSNRFKLEITHENIPPVARLSANRYEIEEHEEVVFDASQSYDDDGYIVAYKFNFGDTATEWLSASVIRHAYNREGIYYAYVEVKDNDGKVSRSEKLMINVLKAEPEPETVTENHIPVIHSLSLQPSTPAPDDNLVCYAAVSDADGNLNNIEFSWLINGNTVKTANKIIAGSNAERSDTLLIDAHAGDKITCKVKVVDKKGAYSIRHVEVTVAARTQPSILSISISPSHPSPTDTLTCSALIEDEDADLSTAKFEWYKNNQFIAKREKSIEGGRLSVSDSIYIPKSDRDIITCVLTVYDSSTLSSSKSASVSITQLALPTLNEPPVFDSISIYPSIPLANNDITCTVSVSDRDGNLNYVVFYWYVDNILVKSITKGINGYSAITSDTLRSSYIEKDSIVRCMAKVYDGKNAWSKAEKSVTVSIVSTAKTPPSIDIPDYHTMPGKSIVIDLWEYASDEEDSDAMLKFFILSQSDTSSAYCVIEHMHYIKCYAKKDGSSVVSVRVFDSSGLFAEDSFTIHVESAKPVINSISLLPEQPTTNDDIICTVMVSDANSDLNYVLFEWYINGIKVKSETKNVYSYSDTAKSTLPRSYTASGDTVRCVASVVDMRNNIARSEKSIAIMQEISLAPVAIISASHYRVKPAVPVYFSGANSYDRDGYITSYYFDFGDGHSSGWTMHSGVYHSYARPGVYNVKLKVMDNTGKISAWSQVTIVVESEDVCGVEITKIEHPTSVVKNAWTKVWVKNTGSVTTKIVLRLYIDGVIKSTYTAILSAGEERLNKFDFVLDNGTYNIKIEAFAYCNSYDYECFTISSVPEPGVEKVSMAPSEPQKVAEFVKVYPDSIDMEVHTGSVITIELQSREKAVYNIEVEGMPRDWLSYPDTVEVEGNKKVYVYVTPHEIGRYSLLVRVSSNETSISKPIGVYAAPSLARKVSKDVTGLFLQKNAIYFAGGIVFIVFISLLYYLIKARRKSYTEEVYGSYY
ncbi:MAG: hypothetical protein DRP03_00990 [Candidatus Aenigmatarchaeota archaeon]|nr:MAG: hypothetical protein DRP03_00990 [Candidatus Aenigmarchaeota archaeon]